MKTVLFAIATLALIACGGQQSASTVKGDDNAPTAADTAETSSFQTKLSCVTADGDYSVKIREYHGPIGVGSGSGPSLSAVITDANAQVVAEYSVVLPPLGIHSISFGHSSYLDKDTNGSEFTLDLPSTNTGYGLVATLKDGSQISYVTGFDHANPKLTCN